MMTVDMDSSVDICVISNPASAARKTASRIPAIVSLLEQEFPGRCSFVLTRAPGHARELARQAVMDTVALLVCVGGDGTLNEIVNGMLEASGGGRPETTLGLISSGSGQGFALSTRLRGSLQEQVGLLSSCPVRPVDLGLIRVGESPSGLHIRYFINECQVGIGAEVVRRARDRGKSAGGLIGYGLATVGAIFHCRNVEATVSVDGSPPDASWLLGLCVGNGDQTAGGMSLTPGARVDDGLLNLLTIRALSLGGRLQSFPRIYSGGHIRLPGFSYRAMKKCAVESAVSLPIAVDGEEVGQTPCEISIVNRGLLVKIPQKDGRAIDEYRFGHHARARI